jgi:hypothetical protein
MDREMNRGGPRRLPRRRDDAGRADGAGRPAVLMPLPTATDDHQRRNAEAGAAGAAVVIEQRQLTASGWPMPGCGAGRRTTRRLEAMATPRAPWPGRTRPRVIVDRALELAAGARGNEREQDRWMLRDGRGACTSSASAASA